MCTLGLGLWTSWAGHKLVLQPIKAIPKRLVFQYSRTSRATNNAPTKLPRTKATSIEVLVLLHLPPSSLIQLNHLILRCQRLSTVMDARDVSLPSSILSSILRQIRTVHPCLLNDRLLVQTGWAVWHLVQESTNGKWSKVLACMSLLTA